MSIDFFRFENAQTSPAYMSPALARHVIATLTLLDPDAAFRTFLQPKLPRQIIAQLRIVYGLPLTTGHPFVRFVVASGAHGREARRAVERRRRRGVATIDLCAIRGGAVFELVWMLFEVRRECSLKQVFELQWWEVFLDHGNRDWDIAARIIA
jgi:hypothetical protein